MIRAVAYVRTSTDRQELSLQAQEAKVRAMAAVRDVALMEVISDEDESGKDLDRPGMKRLMGLVNSRGVDVIIIAKLDRLTRSVRDLADIVELFKKKKVALVSVAETIDTASAGGRMFLTLLGLMAQWEREVISERTSAALQQKRKRGEVAGNGPYGYSRVDNGKLEPNEEEQSVIAAIQSMRGQGKSLRVIADTLNQTGVRTRAGGEWKFQYVANILGAK